MKKILVLMLALALSITVLSACGGDNAPADSGDNTPVTSGTSGGTGADADNDPLAVDVPEGALVKDMTFEELEAALDGISPHADQTTYAEVATLLGVQGEFYDSTTDNERSVRWYASDDGYASFLFRLDTGLMFGGWGVQPEGRPSA